jgi:hypothetical protein
MTGTLSVAELMPVSNIHSPVSGIPALSPIASNSKTLPGFQPKEHIN